MRTQNFPTADRASISIANGQDEFAGGQHIFIESAEEATKNTLPLPGKPACS